MANRTQNVIRNIIWGFLEKIVLLLLPFATRTILIKVLGGQYLGLGSLFGSILSVLSLSELGFGSSIVFSMYKPIAEGDRATVCALLNTFRKIYRIVGSVVILIGLLIMPFVRYFIKGELPLDINIYVLYGIYLINTGISYFMYAYKAALFSAHQRNDLSSKRAMVINIGSNLLQIIVLLIFRNYYLYALILPVATIATNLVNGYLAKKMYPELVCHGRITREMTIDIRKRVTGLFSFKIYGVVFNSVDSLVISSYLGLIPLAIYNNYHYIQTSLISILGIITSSMTASVGNKMVTNSPDDNYEDLNKFTFMNAWLTCWCSICLLCLYQPFIMWWLGEDYLLPLSTMVLLVLQFLVSRISCLTFTYREAAGLWWQDRFRPFFAAIANLTINLALVRFIGINGVVLSTLFCSVFINVPWGTHILFKHYFKRSTKVYFLKVLIYLGIASAAGAITYLLCELLPFSGFASLVFRAIICIVIPNVIFFISYRRFGEFNYAIEFIKSIIGRFLKTGERN